MVPLQLYLVPNGTCLARKICYNAYALKVVSGLSHYDYDITDVINMVLLEMEKLL